MTMILLFTAANTVQAFVDDFTIEPILTTRDLLDNEFLMQTNTQTIEFGIVVGVNDTDTISPNSFEAIASSIEFANYWLSQIDVSVYLKGFYNLNSSAPEDWSEFANQYGHDFILLKLYNLPGFNCGGSPGVGIEPYITVSVDYKGQCLSLLGDIGYGAFMHELGHAFNLYHTGKFNGTCDRADCWFIDGNVHNPCPSTSNAQCLSPYGPCELASGDNSDIGGDLVIDTPADFNYASSRFYRNSIGGLGYRSVYTRYTVPPFDYPSALDEEDLIVDNGNETYVVYKSIDNICMPGYDMSNITFGHFVDGILNPQGFRTRNQQGGLSPYEITTQVYDCNGDPFAPDTRNIMTYSTNGASHFTDDQLQRMRDFIFSNNYYASIEAQNKWSDFVVMNGGDVDNLFYTFSTLEDAFTAIENRNSHNNRIFVLNSMVLGTADLDISKPIFDDPLNPDAEQYFSDLPVRSIYVNIIGVSSLSGIGENAEYVEAQVGEIVFSGNLSARQQIRITGNVDLEIENLSFNGINDDYIFDTNEYPASVIYFNGARLSIDDVIFNSCSNNSSVSSSSINATIPLIKYCPYYHSDDAIIHSTNISNCLFSGNQSPRGNAVVIEIQDGVNEEYDSYVEGCTFVNNSYISQSPYIGALHVSAMSNAIIKNCIFSGSDNTNGTPGYQQCLLLEMRNPPQSGFIGDVDYSLFDQENWAPSYFSGEDRDWTNIVISHEEQVGYVNQTGNDFRLRWDSICMDAGDPSSPIDFDLTPSDIGWTPNYPETEISGTVTLTERGNYKLSNTTTITGIGVNDTDAVIPEGTTIRDDDGYGIIVRDTNATNGYHITIGDQDGARTAIVGTANVVIGSNSAGQVADTRFEGILLNRGPSLNGGALWISNCNLDVDGANGNVRFANYGQTEVVFNEVCRGQFKNFNFQQAQVTGEGAGILCLDVQYSDMDILNVTFDRVNGNPNPWYWKLLHYGTVTGNPTHVIANCIFPSQDNGLGVVPALLSNATLNLHHNQFTDIQVGAIYLGSATLNMRNGAANVFDKKYAQEYTGYPIIDGYLTDSDLSCGYNSFMYGQIQLGDQFIVSNCESTDWSYNFWGTDCTTAHDPAGHIPQCANATPCLAVCPTVFTPCEGQDEESELYALGCAADSLSNYEAALAYWFQLLTEVPDSKYCTEVTSSIKAIGLLTEHGAEAYGAIRSDLEAAAVESEPVDTLLSVYQVCSAWCVEGRHGDREAAVALLDSLYEEKKSNEDMATLISTALAEIDTYPPQGQNNAINPEAEMAQLVHRQERLHNLYRVLVPAMTAQSHAVPEQPSTQVPAR